MVCCTNNKEEFYILATFTRLRLEQRTHTGSHIRTHAAAAAAAAAAALGHFLFFFHTFAHQSVILQSAL
ncbi:unnamed protein product [Sympodiomycopsis kandeliae]